VANRRMISKRISISDRVSAVSEFSQLLYTWIIPHTDDWGRIDGSPKIVKALVMPLSKRKEKDFEKSLKEMADLGLITWYAVDNRLFIHILGFENHQTGLEKRTHSKFPDIPLKTDDGIYPSEKFSEVLRNSSLTKPNLTKPNSIKLVHAEVVEDVEDLEGFGRLWEKYPKKLGKREALKHFKSSVKGEADLGSIAKALDNYLSYIKTNKIEEKYIKHGSTWFHGWKDWVEYKSAKMEATIYTGKVL